MPTIRGELRKHFRDHGWMIRPPRRIQELQARINIAEAELSNELGRSPQPAEIADHLDECTESVIEALASDGCFVPASLDHPAGGDGLTTLGDLLSFDDAEHRASEARLMLRPSYAASASATGRSSTMRFYEGLTQREIATRIGVTQMQVSRLLTRILGPAAQRGRRGPARPRRRRRLRPDGLSARPACARRAPGRRASGKSVSTPSTPRSRSHPTSVAAWPWSRPRPPSAQLRGQVLVLAAQRPDEHVEPAGHRLDDGLAGRPDAVAVVARAAPAACAARPPCA